MSDDRDLPAGDFSAWMMAVQAAIRGDDESDVRWSFTYQSDDDRTQHDAVRASAVYLRDQRDAYLEGNAPATATQLAVDAIEAHVAFVGRDEQTGRTRIIDPEPEAVRVVLSRRT